MQSHHHSALSKRSSQDSSPNKPAGQLTPVLEVREQLQVPSKHEPLLLLSQGSEADNEPAFSQS